MNKQVASFTDAWIETQLRSVGRDVENVASFTDAWIETDRYCQENEPKKVASFTDAWIETIEMKQNGAIGFSRIFYRCVD